jgi:hypothetical protein
METFARQGADVFRILISYTEDVWIKRRNFISPGRIFPAPSPSQVTVPKDPAFPPNPRAMGMKVTSPPEISAVPRDRLSWDGFGLIYEHDGDIILDLIQELALVADEPIAGFVQVDVPLAFGTG